MLINPNSKLTINHEPRFSCLSEGVDLLLLVVHWRVTGDTGGTPMILFVLPRRSARHQVQGIIGVPACVPGLPESEYYAV
jgi:hypothetical protein